MASRLECPVCKVGQIYTRIKTNSRRCLKCGYVGKLEEFVQDGFTLTVEESGTVYLVGTDAKTITLPATAEGTEYTFINRGIENELEDQGNKA